MTQARKPRLVRWCAGAGLIGAALLASGCTTYGYDPVTAMHEGKATLCRIEAA